MKNLIKTFIADEAGASAAEYALLLAVIGIGIVLGAQALEGAISNSLNGAANTINTEVTAA